MLSVHPFSDTSAPPNGVAAGDGESCGATVALQKLTDVFSTQFMISGSMHGGMGGGAGAAVGQRVALQHCLHDWSGYRCCLMEQDGGDVVKQIC